MKPIIQVTDIERAYGSGQSRTHALGPVSFEVRQGQFVVIVGRSGSGKSTLLNLLCGLDTATKGTLIVNGKNLTTLGSKDLANYRSTIGIVFQSYNLLPNLNTTENILLGAWVGGGSATEEDANAILKTVNLDHRAKANVKNLSGGERQRVSIARSLIGNPDILFCDEPTGALDSHNEATVISILKSLNKSGKTIVMVTHNPEFKSLADLVIELQDGKMVTPSKVTTKAKLTKK